MAVVDIVFLVIIAIFAFRCAARGFIGELLSMAALIFGMLAAICFFRWGGLIIRSWFMPEVRIIPEVIAFIVLFVIVFITIKTIEITLKGIIEKIQLGGLDRMLGLLFGFVEGIIIVCLIIFVINIMPPVVSGPALEQSFFARILLPFIFGNKKEILESVVLLHAPGRVLTGV
ncbi:MAG: CvpA family protein [Treponema sp.]|jgi:membrane protein required for colicin V production|nr:CvpA family protein [Treponema sp.]